MNWDQIEGQWKNIKGHLREKWGKITDNDFEVIAGKKDRMLGKIQERYGIGQEAAERELDHFIESINKKSKQSS